MSELKRCQCAHAVGEHEWHLVWDGDVMTPKPAGRIRCHVGGCTCDCPGWYSATEAEVATND